MIGPMALVGGGLGALFARIRWTRFRALTAGTAAASIIAGQVVLTRAQCETWRSSEALWTHALNHGGEDVPDVRNSVGLSLVELWPLEEAKEHFVAASLLRPSWGDPHNNLGVLFARENNTKTRAAISRKPFDWIRKHQKPMRTLGKFFCAMGMSEPQSTNSRWH
jgi:hypothetical protein